MKLADYLHQNGRGEADFAHALGVTTKAVQTWISGDRIPRPTQMQKIIDETNGAVTPNDFFVGCASPAADGPFRSQAPGGARAETAPLPMAAEKVSEAAAGNAKPIPVATAYPREAAE